MKTQFILIKFRNCPSTSSQSSGKWWPQLLFSHQPWTPVKEFYQLSSIVLIWRHFLIWSLENIFKPMFRNHSADSFSFFQDRFLWHTVDLQQSPGPASHHFFTFSHVFPWYSETPCALQSKVNFLARHWRGKSGRNFMYAGQPMQFTFSDHPYIKRALWVVFPAGLNNFTSEDMCAAALGVSVPVSGLVTSKWKQ